MVRAIHVVAGLDAAHGGPSYSVPRLCRALAATGVEVALLSVASKERGFVGDRSENDYLDRRFRWDHACVPVLRELRKSSRLAGALRDAAARSDVIHNHGLWLLPNLYSGWEAARAKKPLVVSPRGMLSSAALSFSPLKKKALWRLLQGSVVRRAACLHATSEQEYQEIRAFGLDNPVAVIPNGVDIPEFPSEMTQLESDDRVVLSLGRLHPKKGLDRLLFAWAKVEAQHPDWRLRIAGPPEGGHDVELRSLAARLGLARVSIEGPIYGEEKWTAYRQADLFVLPTLNENFGLTVAEALAAGIPVISTKGAPWSGLGIEGCGWWINHGIEPLAAALSKAMNSPQRTLTTMGTIGRTWIMRDYSWESVASNMLNVYRWLLNHGDRATNIRLA